MAGTENTKASELLHTPGGVRDIYGSACARKLEVQHSLEQVMHSYASQYADSGESVAYTGGFLSSFSNAVSTLSSSGSFSDGGSFSGASCGFSGGSCGASSGGFTSVC